MFNTVKSESYGCLVKTPVKMAAEEMCFVQYMPIKFPWSFIRIPDNLEWVQPMVDILKENGSWSDEDYVYLTAKHLYVTPDNIGNRPGWHIDGYLSDDTNYIWYNRFPTEVANGEFHLSPDHEMSLVQMEEQVDCTQIVTFPNYSILKLDPFTVHRSPIITEGSMRTFVKISVSKFKYNLKGNAHNYLFDYDWRMYPRNATRNHPYVIVD